MTPEEKALIDARRDGYTEALRREVAASDEWIVAEAARAFPYPPEPKTVVDSEGDEWRIVDGRVEFRMGRGDFWHEYEGWLTPAMIRGLYRLLPPETETTP